MESRSELLHTMDELQQIAFWIVKEDDLVLTLNSPNRARETNALHLKVTIAGLEIIDTECKVIEPVLALSDYWRHAGGDDLQHSPKWQPNKIGLVGLKGCCLFETERLTVPASSAAGSEAAMARCSMM
jgi:hypothetical protein